jgi:D-alanyl-D-alanine carboxypeptidase
MSTHAAPATATLLSPHGLDNIIATFGDIFAYIGPDHTLDARWQGDFLDRVALPFALPLSWDISRSVRQFTCHKCLVPVFTRVFADIHNAALQSKLTSFGGCFAFRPQRTGAKLSAHAWGITIDLNPETNQQGTVGSMDSSIVAIFRQNRFEWGGSWRGRHRDPMHFQFCTGY